MALGILDVDDMLRKLTAKQFAMWRMYASVMPFGDLRADYQAASVSKTIADVNRPKERQPYKVEDFLLQFEAPEQESHGRDTQISIIKAIAQAYATPAKDLN